MMPVSARSTPARIRSRVVFPAPLSPRMTTLEPRSIARSTSVKISSDPYDFDRPRAMRGVLPHGAGLGKRSLATRSSWRSEEHTSELQSLMRISYAVFCLKKKTNKQTITYTHRDDENIVQSDT